MRALAFALMCLFAQIFGQATIPCTFTDPSNGFKYNLESLVSNSADYVVEVPTGTDNMTTQGYKISLNVCRPIFNQACVTQAGSTCDACQQWPISDPKFFNALGQTTATTFLPAQDTTGQDGEGTTLNFAGFTVSMKVNFVCDTGAGKGHPTYVTKPTANSFLLKWKSKYACATNGNASSGGSGGSGGLSGGSIMMIIILVVVVVYVAAGVSWQKFKNHAEGTDLIPNKEFWTGLPGLVKDGVMFTVGKIKGLGGGGGYQKM